MKFTRNSFLYVFRIILGCLISWWALALLHIDRREWALITVIIVSEPDFENLRNNTISRVINTLAGCAVGLIFLLLTGVTFLSMILGVTASILISTSYPRYPSSWKLAPVTVVIVMVPSVMSQASLSNAIVVALTRAGEVLVGCVVAFLLGLIFARLHRLRMPFRRR
ncbi:FUSC family protein [Dinghuibacter silviterrae]|uniref:Fusaric acid resistance family protein n=1 Tax=Dinghuibacter silviterrae TaxID=1539049 RepID=A0A4R8DHY8_9BACT|nr:FUSC family protein [Dinghuibacter silviterrae]TDW97353.1 fusaric acid resistance family protein [Dinghuibacter silviterrae]